MEIAKKSVLKVSQQELNSLSAEKSRDMAYTLARSCVPHCLAAAQEMLSEKPYDVEELLSFIDKYGPHGVSGEDDNDYYRENEGWQLMPLADVLRKNGKHVVVQNMHYSPEDTDIDKMRQVGRITDKVEEDMASVLQELGGDNKEKWVESIRWILSQHGLSVPTISIPRMDGQGTGGHAVVVESIQDDIVRYFDPDRFAIDRYKLNGLNVPGISPVAQDDGRFFQQPIREFAQRLTGEIIHIL